MWISTKPSPTFGMIRVCTFNEGFVVMIGYQMDRWGSSNTPNTDAKGEYATQRMLDGARSGLWMSPDTLSAP